MIIILYAQYTRSIFYIRSSSIFRNVVLKELYLAIVNACIYVL